MPTYVRKVDDEIVEKISPEPRGPEDLRLAAACRAEDPVWEVADETEVEELRTTTSSEPVATAERPEVPAAPPTQGRPPQSPAAKKAEKAGESSDG